MAKCLKRNLTSLPPTKEEVNAFAHVRLSVCLWARLLKKACMDLGKSCLSTDVGTWTNWLTFEPDPDYSPDAGTGLLSPISYALQRGILLRRDRYWAAATRGFTMVLFTASRRNNFVGGTWALPSALLVICLVALRRLEAEESVQPTWRPTQIMMTH